MTEIKITIKAFASVKDILGFSEKDMNVPEGSTITEILGNFISDKKELDGIKDSLLFSINEVYSYIEENLKDGDTLAIFPPVSGG